MKALKKIAIGLVLMCMVAGVAFAADPVKIRLASWWWSKPDGVDTKPPAFQAAIAKFKETHPNVVIEQEFAAGEDMKTKMNVNLAGGDMPDMMTYWLAKSFIQPMVDAGVLLDVDQYFQKSKVQKKTDWTVKTWQDTASNGVNYGLPIEGYRGFWLYNKDIFAKYNLTPPATWDELKNVSAVLRKNNIIPLNYGSKNSIPGHFLLTLIAVQQPNGGVESDTIGQTYKFDTPAFVKATEVIAEMRDLKMFPSDTIANGGWPNATTLFVSGRAAMYYAFPWELGKIKDSKVNVGIMSIPAFPGAVVDPKTVNLGGANTGLFINKKSFSDPKKMQALIDLADILLADSLFKGFAEGGTVPAKNVVFGTNDLDPFYRTMFNSTTGQKNYAYTKAYLPSAAVLTAFQNDIDELFAGSMSAKQYVKSVQNALDEAKEESTKKK